jgi:adenosine deaminase
MNGFTITYQKAGLTITIHASDERGAKRVIVQALKDAEVSGITVRREVVA